MWLANRCPHRASAAVAPYGRTAEFAAPERRTRRQSLCSSPAYDVCPAKARASKRASISNEKRLFAACRLHTALRRSGSALLSALQTCSARGLRHADACRHAAAALLPPAPRVAPLTRGRRAAIPQVYGGPTSNVSCRWREGYRNHKQDAPSCPSSRRTRAGHLPRPAAGPNPRGCRQIARSGQPRSLPTLAPGPGAIGAHAGAQVPGELHGAGSSGTRPGAGSCRCLPPS